MDMLNPAGTAPASDAFDVSILIPVHNRVDLTRACLESVFCHAEPSLTTELLLTDDCSTDDTAEYLASLGEQVRVIRNTLRRDFGHNMNVSARLARGRYLCLLNNDTLVTRGWLTKLVEAAEGDRRIGVVGNKHLYPGSGKIQHAGMAFHATGLPVHMYPGMPPDFPAANNSREFQIVTAACWLVPRDLFLQLGGFDPAFKNGYEDVDFCLRVRETGRIVYYVADSVIYHYGQSSPGRKNHDDANCTYFQEKWRGRIVPDLHTYLARDGLLPASASVPKNETADVHFAIPLEAGNSFTWATAQLALACEEIGLKVSLANGPVHASVEGRGRGRLQRMMDRSPSSRAQIRWNHYWAPYQDREVAGRVTAEIFVTNYRYGPRPLHELDFWMRHAVLNPNRKLPISTYSMEALTELGVPAERCRVVPLGYSPEAAEGPGDDRFRPHGFVFLALTNAHDPYRYGTDILLRAYGKAFSRRDKVVLVLKDYGGKLTGGPLRRWLDEAADGPRVIHFAEFLSKDALLRLYRGCDAFVAPFRGEGFGMKIVDACAAGLPVLAPLYGGPTDYLRPGGFYPLAFTEVPVGECLDQVEGVVPPFAQWAEVDAEDLAVQMRTVVDQNEEARRRAAVTRELVLKEFSWQQAARRLAAALVDFEKEREAVVAPRRLAGPPAHKVSVIIPTRNRPDVLRQCLDAYTRQTLPAAQWEICIVDDASSYDVRNLVAGYQGRLPLRLLVNPTRTGQGKARNRAVPGCRGELILFTGDDIIPARTFLAEHVKAHDGSRAPETAVLGRIDWHPDLKVTPLMDYITREGGQQFAFANLTPNTFVPYGYFYTSNVSIKRALLVEQEELFSDRFHRYGYEDVEIGLRLSRAGMRLLYAPWAEATHLHALTDAEVYRRQYEVGRMQVVFAALHPQRVSEDHRVFLRWLECFQHTLQHDEGFPRAADALRNMAAALDGWLNGLSVSSAGMAEVSESLRAKGRAESLLGREAAHWNRLGKQLYAYRLDLAMRDGMADEWVGVEAGCPNPARDFLRFYLSSSVWDLLGRGSPQQPMPSRRLMGGRLFQLVRRLRQHPWASRYVDRSMRLPVVRLLAGAARRVLARMP
jgi:GT2 family glycosyltransferase/glycosyltransferase involved in cell wall biosynthesis